MLPESLFDLVERGWERFDAQLSGAGAEVALRDLATGSHLDLPVADLDDCSILIRTDDQLTAALALIELDGIARRLVICPPDSSAEHARQVMSVAGVDVVLSDLPESDVREGAGRHVTCVPAIRAARRERQPRRPTDWVLLTSGTTGMPKLVLHNLASLTGAISPGAGPGDPAVWSTFYDIRRYGGLQILLRALLGHASMVLSSAREPLADFLARAGAHGVTHISGTPSHWRRALMSPWAGRITPRYVRLSGEIADQAILDQLHATFPAADMVHAFASTEAGVAFTVGDGLAGFPAQLIEQPPAGVELKIEDGSLRIRSTRTAPRYLDDGSAIRDPDGFVDTGDLVERRGDRYHFVGRRGGIINVGGLKVQPEEVEAVINRHPRVQMSLVKGRKSPITGAVVTADVVLRAGPDDEAPDAIQALKSAIIDHCRDALAAHKVPVIVRVVPQLAIGVSGKLARRDA